MPHSRLQAYVILLFAGGMGLRDDNLHKIANNMQN
jgi:hypothetical protein